jgi:hypothetical protein
VLVVEVLLLVMVLLLVLVEVVPLPLPLLLVVLLMQPGEAVSPRAEQAARAGARRVRARLWWGAPLREATSRRVGCARAAGRPARS